MMSQREIEAPREESFRAVARLGCLQHEIVVQIREGWKWERSIPNAATGSCDKGDLALEFFGHSDRASVQAV